MWEWWEKVWCTICVGEGPWKGGGSAGAERSGRSVMEMNGTNGKTKGRKLWAVQLRFVSFGLFALGFFVGNVLQVPLNTHSGNLLRFISNTISFCRSAS